MQSQAFRTIFVILGAAITLSACNQNPARQAGNEGSAQGANAAAPAAPPSQDDLNWIWATSRDVLGVNPAFAEKKLGPAKRKERWSETQANWTFEIGGCEVKYLIEDDEIGAFTVPLAQSCTPSFKGLAGLEGKAARGTNFADLLPGLPGGDWRSDCLESCGNAYAPSLFYVAEGGRSAGFVAIVLQTPQTGDAAIAAGNNWLKAIRATGPADGANIVAGKAQGAGTTADPREADAATDILDDSLYRCGNAPAQDVIAAAAAKLPVASITVGTRALDGTGISCTAG